MKTSETTLHADSDSYFIVDEHISELGHKRLAKAILRRLRSINPQGKELSQKNSLQVRLRKPNINLFLIKI